MQKIILLLMATFTAQSGFIHASAYKRDNFNYVSYKSNSSIGFYTGEACRSINIDHVVSLKDAYNSGASDWSETEKTVFANDRGNHVPSCRKVNSSKGFLGPEDFLRISRDKKGLDYEIVDFCSYVSKYYKVKIKYSLSFTLNSKDTFLSCGINI